MKKNTPISQAHSTERSAQRKKRRNPNLNTQRNGASITQGKGGEKKYIKDSNITTNTQKTRIGLRSEVG